MSLISPDALIQADAMLIAGIVIYAKLGKSVRPTEFVVPIRGAIICFVTSMIFLLLCDLSGLLAIPEGTRYAELPLLFGLGFLSLLAFPELRAK